MYLIKSSVGWVSEDGAGLLGDRIGTFNLRILALVKSPEFLRSFLLHFDLHIVFADFILSQDKLARVLNKDASVAVFDSVSDDVRGGTTSGEHARPRVVHHAVTFDLAIRVDEHDTILVTFNLIVFYEEITLTFDDENALSALGIENIVVHDTSLACFFTTQCNISLDVVFDLVRDDLA